MQTFNTFILYLEEFKEVKREGCKTTMDSFWLEKTGHGCQSIGAFISYSKERGGRLIFYHQLFRGYIDFFLAKTEGELHSNI